MSLPSKKCAHGWCTLLMAHREGWVDIHDIVSTLYHKRVPVCSTVGINQNFSLSFDKTSIYILMFGSDYHGVR